MALVDCSECGNQVSDKAKSCPQCGAPIGAAGDVQTVEDTSKKYKMHMLCGGALAGLGLIGTCGSWPTGGQAYSTASILFMLSLLGGIFWLWGARMAAWWNHG